MVERVVSKKRHREGRIEHKDYALTSEHKEEVALAQQERRLKETKLERRIRCN